MMYHSITCALYCIILLPCLPHIIGAQTSHEDANNSELDLDLPDVTTYRGHFLSLSFGRHPVFGSNHVDVQVSLLDPVEENSRSSGKPPKGRMSTLPSWLYYNGTAKSLQGVPGPHDKKRILLHVRTKCRPGHKIVCRESQSVFQINVVERVWGQSLKWQQEGNTLSADSQPEVDISGHGQQLECDDDKVVSSLILCTSVKELSTSNKVQLVRNLARFLSIPDTAVSIESSMTQSLKAVEFGFQIISAGAGTGEECPMDENIEVMWQLSCPVVKHLTDFVKVLQHNVDVGRLQMETGFGLVGWYIASSNSLLTRRNRRRRHASRLKTPILTPTLVPPSPSVVMSSSEEIVASTSQYMTSTVSSQVPTVSTASNFISSSLPSPFERDTNAAESLSPTDVSQNVLLQASNSYHTQFSSQSASTTAQSKTDVEIEPSVSLPVIDTHHSTGSPLIVHPYHPVSSEPDQSLPRAVSSQSVQTPPLASFPSSDYEINSLTSIYSHHSVSTETGDVKSLEDARSVSEQLVVQPSHSMDKSQISYTTISDTTDLNVVPGQNADDFNPSPSFPVPSSEDVTSPSYAITTSSSYYERPAPGPLPAEEYVLGAIISEKPLGSFFSEKDKPNTLQVDLGATPVITQDVQMSMDEEDKSDSDLNLQFSKDRNGIEISSTIHFSLEKSDSVSDLSYEGAKISRSRNEILPSMFIHEDASDSGEVSVVPVTKSLDISFISPPESPSPDLQSFMGDDLLKLALSANPNTLSDNTIILPIASTIAIESGPTENYVYRSDDLAEVSAAGSMSDGVATILAMSDTKVDDSLVYLDSSVVRVDNTFVYLDSTITDEGTMIYPSASHTTDESSVVEIDVIDKAIINSEPSTVQPDTLASAYSDSQMSSHTVQDNYTGLLPMDTKTSPTITTETTTLSTTERMDTTERSTTRVRNTSGYHSTTGSNNSCPTVLKPLGLIIGEQGRVLELTIPRDMFYDTDDDSLVLSLELPSGKKLPSNFWLYLVTIPPKSKGDKPVQMLKGLPLHQDMDIKNVSVVLVATNSEGLQAKDSIILQINDSPRTQFTHKFTLRFAIDFQEFIHKRGNIVDLMGRIATHFKDETARFMTVLEVRKGSFILSWTNNTLSGSVCQQQEVKQLLNRMLRKDHTVRSTFNRNIGRNLELLEIGYEPMGACVIPTTTTTVTTTLLASSRAGSGLSIWAHVILPILIALVVFIFILFLICMCNRHRKRREALSILEKDAFSNERNPIILPNEMDSDDMPSLQPKSPLVLPSDTPSSNNSPQHYPYPSGDHQYQQQQQQQQQQHQPSIQHPLSQSEEYSSSSSSKGRNNNKEVKSKDKSKNQKYHSDNVLGGASISPSMSSSERPGNLFTEENIGDNSSDNITSSSKHLVDNESPVGVGGNGSHSPTKRQPPPYWQSQGHHPPPYRLPPPYANDKENSESPTTPTDTATANNEFPVLKASCTTTQV